MEVETATKKPKPRTENLRVLRETKKRILADLSALNKKDFGRRITADDYVSLAVTLLRPEHLEQIRDRSLSNQDRLRKRFEDHCAKNGKVSMDEFLGTLLTGGAR